MGTDWLVALAALAEVEAEVAAAVAAAVREYAMVSRSRIAMVVRSSQFCRRNGRILFIVTHEEQIGQ